MLACQNHRAAQRKPDKNVDDCRPHGFFNILYSSFYLIEAELDSK